MVKNKVEKESMTVAPPHYERINFLFDFNLNGYAKKILWLYEDANQSGETVYYNNRELTEIACVDKDILILNNHGKGHNNTYTLVQVDFSLPSKYKILMVRNSDVITNTINAKNEFYMYMRQENLVEIRSEKPKKQPQIEIDFGNDNMLIEIIEFLYSSTQSKTSFYENNLIELLKRNIWCSNKFVEYEKDFTRKETATIRMNHMIEYNVNLIYRHSDKDTMTLPEVLSYIKKYQENYYYNI